jgi:hypothetical protein
VPSSISSSDITRALDLDSRERGPADGESLLREPDRYARQTAADRPGVAQPVPLRPVPEQPWGRILVGAALLLALLVGGWEWYWRAYGVPAELNNSDGLWAIERRRIDAGEGDATVLLGASRVYFDVQVPVWTRLEGRRPVQLSFEGTAPLVALADLADDARFTGRVLVGVAPDVFFGDYKNHVAAVRYAHKESPSQRIGQWLSMHFIEPYFAFDDSDFALQTILARQPWPQRPGRQWYLSVRKLGVIDSVRNMHMWSKLETDPDYRELARNIWRQDFKPSPNDPSPEEARKTAQEQIDAAAKAVAKLRARGVKVLFVRLPSGGEYLAYEQRDFPRARTWDALLAATGAPGIHFEDYPELQGYELPEWSHMTYAEAVRFTPVLYALIMRDFWGPDALRRATEPVPAGGVRGAASGATVH